MPNQPDLLSQIFYGNEFSDKARAMSWLNHYFSGALAPYQLDRAYESVSRYFSTPYTGVFGGQITAGDGLFIAAKMEKLRPNRMIEFGVASGYSSAFILEHAKSMGLLDDKPFLYSYDLVAVTDTGNVTGSYLKSERRDLLDWWELETETTSADLVLNPSRRPKLAPDERVLAFVDGGHNHPWPVMDLAFLRGVLHPSSWVILQDSQMMERWIADSVKYGTVCPTPVRGVNLAVSLWPGRKIIGHGICYNCAAVQLNISRDQFSYFAKESLQYPDEIDFDHEELIYAATLT